MINLLEQFTSYIEHNHLLTEQDKVLLAVSGGVDSMVLLELFANSRYKIGVAHCNFCLRGDESDEDEVVVADRAAMFNLEAFNKRFDTIGEMERTGDSMEMVARRQRYNWFNELCQEHGYTAIAIAHHTDDSIETFFINLFRGTGLKGVTGIKTRMGRVVRPLSFATRRDILEYAASHHIPFREDSSNKSTKYLRNKIRLGLLPRLKEISPKFTQTMQGNISRLYDAQIFISSCIKEIATDVISEQDGIYTIHIEKISKNLPINFVVYELLSSQFGFKGDVIDSLNKAHKEGNSGKRLYSKDYVAYIDRGDVLVTRIPTNDSCVIEVPKEATRSYCGNSILHIERVVIDIVESFDLGESVALLDEDKLQYPLTLRRWQEGDSFTPLGMDGHKKVSDFLIDTKVSQPEKERQFVLLSGDEIVWIVGRRIDDKFKLSDDTESVVKITKEIIQ